MSKSPKKPARAWRVVADEMSHANRGNQILELAEELEQALHEQSPSTPKPPEAVGPDIAGKGAAAQKQTPPR